MFSQKGTMKLMVRHRDAFIVQPGVEIRSTAGARAEY